MKPYIASGGAMVSESMEPLLGTMSDSELMWISRGSHLSVPRRAQTSRECNWLMYLSNTHEIKRDYV